MADEQKDDLPPVVSGPLRRADQGSETDRLLRRLVDEAIDATNARGATALHHYLRAYINAYVNLAAVYQLDAGHQQRILRHVADTMPEIMQTIQLDNSEPAGEG